jgi:hypothetical protein
MACTASRNTAAKKTFEEVHKPKRDKCRQEIMNIRKVGSSDDQWSYLGTGDIVVDSAADESCWPVGRGEAFPTVKSDRKLILRTANGADMTHYGQKAITFAYDDPEGRKSDPLGLIFQVTDVGKPLLSVRRLVEKGNVVYMELGGGYILNVSSGVKVPLVKKGGSFVIEAKFVQHISTAGAGATPSGEEVFARPA